MQSCSQAPLQPQLAHVPTSSWRADCHLVKCSSSSSSSSSQHPKPPGPAPLLRDQLYHLPMTVTALAAASKVFCHEPTSRLALLQGLTAACLGPPHGSAMVILALFAQSTALSPLHKAKADPRMKAREAHTAEQLNPFKVASLLIQFA